jgi:hypothetical protein
MVKRGEWTDKDFQESVGVEERKCRKFLGVECGVSTKIVNRGHRNDDNFGMKPRDNGQIHESTPRLHNQTR